MLSDVIQWLKLIARKPGRYNHLRKYSILKDLSSFELHLISNHLHTRQYKKGEFLFEEGYPLEALFLIENGEVEVTGTFNPHGAEILKKGQFLGLIDMFLENTRSSNARAHTEVSVLSISKTDLWYLIENNQGMGIKLLKSTSNFLCRYLLIITAGK